MASIHFTPLRSTAASCFGIGDLSKTWKGPRADLVTSELDFGFGTRLSTVRRKGLNGYVDTAVEVRLPSGMCSERSFEVLDPASCD